MILVEDMEQRFSQKLNELEGLVANMKNMVSRGYLKRNSSLSELEPGFSWLKEIEDITQTVKKIDRGIFMEQVNSDDRPIRK